MKLNLSQSAYTLLKVCLSITGEKELNQKGEEVMSPRRLNGEESAQRRHYFKAIDSKLEENNKKALEAGDKHNEKLKKLQEDYKKKNPQNKKESTEDYDKRINSLLNNDKTLMASFAAAMAVQQQVNKEKFEIDITDKTVEVIKKYYKEYSDQVGWGSGDDEVVEEIEEAFV